MIDTGYGREAAGAVTGFTLWRSHDVLRRLIGGPHPATLDMAADTPSRRSGKHAITVASIAGDDLVSTIKAETRCEVVKRGSDASLPLRRRRVEVRGEEDYHRE